jgi:hypothetical protein
MHTSGTRGSRPVRAFRPSLAAVLGGLALALLFPVAALGAGEVLPDLDARTGNVAPTAGQQAIVAQMGASVSWNRFGTPESLVKQGGFLAQGVSGATAAAAALNWVDANKALFRLGSTSGLKLMSDERMLRSNGYAVVFRQEFGGLSVAEGGILTVGIVGTPLPGGRSPTRPRR